MVSLLNAARDIGRIREVTTVLVRHGFGEIVRRVGLSRPKKAKEGTRSDRPADFPPVEEEERGAREQREISLAVRVRMVLEDLGPSFIKLGQIASTRADLLPPEVIRELGKLQDSVAPVTFSQIKEQVERSLGAELCEVYESFDESPLAAASIAQVHRARLKSEAGSHDVVVKVQRPGIAETIASDLDILHTLAALLERTMPESRLYSPVGLVQQFDRAIQMELDFTAEAENAARFAKNAEGMASVRFPIVYREASTKHVLTLEYLDGKKIFDAIAAGHVGRKLARIALDVTVRQMFEDGFFHADPHPGNILVLGDPDNPTLALIDLGMVGRLSPRMRDLIVDLMISVVRSDHDGIADALYALGTPTKKIDMNAYRAEVALLSDKYLGKRLGDIQLSLLVTDLVKSAKKYGIEIPSDFLMVGKALMTVEGIGKQIDPDLDVFEESKPLFTEIVRKRYSPERLAGDFLRRIERLSGTTYQLPERIEEVLDDLRLGRLSLRTEDPNLRSSADRLGRRVFSGLVVAALILSGAALSATERSATLGHVLLGGALMWLTIHAARDVWRSLQR
jgi:ubiquinone biosynthesis protein